MSVVVEGTADKLRKQRDRFIAFAFAGADLLLEIDDGGKVAYSAGAGEALYGLADDDLFGKSLAEFIYPRDRSRFDDAIVRLMNTGRLDHTPLALMGATGVTTRMRMAGIRLPNFPGCHLALSRIPPMVIESDDKVGDRADPKTRFVEMVLQRLNEANRVGQEVLMTLVDVSGRQMDSLDPAVAGSLLSTVHHALEEISIDGTSAAPLGGRSFGLVHSPGTPPQAIQAKLEELKEVFGRKLAGLQLKMRSASLDMEDSTLGTEDITKAITYVVNSFVKDSAQFAISSLIEGARVAAEDTLTRVRNFRRMLKSGSLTFLYQPVVNLRTGVVLNYEAFARMSHNGVLFPPSTILPFAADVGVIGEFDLIAVRQITAAMRAVTEISPLANIAINISGHSLSNPLFFRSLTEVLSENKSLLGRLVLEITNASAIPNLDEARRMLGRIRKMGVRICLDDFGTGGSAFDLLRTLPVDFAKLDSRYIVDARDPKGLAVLKALAGLCRDLKIATIGEMVEDADTVMLMRDVGLDYAQGYYFAQPAADGAKKVRYFTEHVKAAGTAEPVLVSA